MNMSNDWYSLRHPEQIDSPALMVYPDRIRHNIHEMIRMAGDPARLVPHIKTHKMSAVVKMQLEAGIDHFKCATIAEAEMLGRTGARDVLIAYQLHEPKAKRLLQLVKQFPATHFSSLVDNTGSAQLLNDLFADQFTKATVYIDVDNGMHRTGISVNRDIAALYHQINTLPHVFCRGLHVYDGHLHLADFEERKRICLADFAPVQEIIQTITRNEGAKPEVIAGGSPSFPIHAQNPAVLCSPGTSLLWDQGYATQLSEQAFLPAAVLLTRIISMPGKNRVTTDLGHKSVAAENTIDKRISFLNIDNYRVISQSEEHLVLEVSEQEREKLAVGAELYGIPYHICPTVALYDEVQVVRDKDVTEQWAVEARRKRINV